MDPRAVTLASTAVAAGEALLDFLRWMWNVLSWTYAHAVWLGAVGALMACVWVWGERLLAARAVARRTYVELVPSRQFESGEEEIWRYGAQLLRAASAGKWWTPRSARTVRIRMRADGRRPLTYRVEGPAKAKHLLMQTPYARVRTKSVGPVSDKARKFTVRGVFVLHGLSSARLREVPLDPDPLQPLLDAVADLRAEMGDLAEVCLDLSPGHRWGLKARRWQVLNTARQRARQEARREARWLSEDAVSMEDSLSWQLTRLLVPSDRQGGGRRLLMTPRPQRLDRDKVLGNLAEDAGLVRVQLLVRCASDEIGRAERRLRHIEAALDVFAARTRWSSLGISLASLRFGPDSWPWRPRFDGLWRTGLMRPGRDSWARIDEIAGLLKPPTKSTRLPVLTGDIPSYHHGRDLLPQGHYRGPDGKERLVATRESDTLFEVQVGKAGWGKTMRALCQAAASAHSGRGLAFVDPHGDSWHTIKPYLGNKDVASRVRLYDLTVRGQQAVGCWNPLSMGSGKEPHEVTSAVVDAFASSLGWNDSTAPRAITILTKAVEALVAINAAAVSKERPETQATVFQLRPLLTDPSFRSLVVQQLGTEARRWWESSFEDIPRDALPTVLNPLDRLAAAPVTRAFLGSPIGSYDIRRSMDESHIVWICPAGTGPTDRLLVSLLVRDMLRAGLSRRDTVESSRVPFRLYLDELISLDGAASSSLAEITEQLRKFRVRMHGMTQLLHRLGPEVRTALLQNASCLSTTAGSIEAIRYITDEWGDQVSTADAAELPRYHHWASFTVGGNRVGPLLIRGPELSELFDDLLDRDNTLDVAQASRKNTAARPLTDLVTAADGQEEVVRNFLNNLPSKKPCTQNAADQSRETTEEDPFR
jgi:hypothetical protein